MGDQKKVEDLKKLLGLKALVVNGPDKELNMETKRLIMMFGGKGGDALRNILELHKPLTNETVEQYEDIMQKMTRR